MTSGLQVLLTCLIASAGSSAAIDLVQDVGNCKRLSMQPDSSLIYANEGIWFPQYRTYRRGVEDFSCHTVYAGLTHAPDDNALALEEISYFSVRGEGSNDPDTVMLKETKTNGVYTTEQFIAGYGEATKYFIVLQISPEVRLRYVCTNSTRVKDDFDLVYIETRRAVGLYADVMDGVRTLSEAGLRGRLVRINQINCTRPLSKLGYDESLFFDDSDP